MTKKVLQGGLFLILCFITLNNHAQEKCPFPSSEVQSNSNDITGEAVVLLKQAAPGQKLFLDHVHIANNSGQIYCTPTVSFYISNPKPNDSCQTLPYKVFIAGHPDSTRLTIDQLLKGGRLVTNVDAINAKNQAGQTFCLEKVKMTVR